MKTSRQFVLATSGAICLLLVMLQGSNASASNVSARLVQTQANSAVVEIALSGPAPSNLIVDVYLPRNTPVVGTNPAPAKIDGKKGNIRWLIKDTQPGTISVHFTTGRPFSRADSSAVIRYRLPGSGTMVEVPAAQ